MYVQTVGSSTNPAIIFIHGFGSWSETWKPAISAAAEEGFYAVAVDMPPFGFSERPNPSTYSREHQAARITGVMDALGIERALFVGHSYGAGSTMEAVFSAPDRVSGVVLVAGALSFDPLPSPPPLLSVLFSIKPLRNAGIAATATNPSFTKKSLEMFIYNPADATDEKVRVYQMPLSITNSTNDLGDWLQNDMFAPLRPSRSSNRKHYAQLIKPVLLIWGDQDTVTPLSQAHDLKSLIPTAELSILPDIGHIPQIENEALFNKTLVQFLRRHRNTL